MNQSKEDDLAIDRASQRFDEQAEDMEELEELEEASEESRQEAVLPADDRIRCFSESQFPFLIVDRSLLIVHANVNCERLFTGHHELPGRYFSDLFAKSLGKEELKRLFDSIHSKERSFSWKGMIQSKNRTSGTLVTRAYLFPLYTASCQEPDYFVMLLDDVTEENRRLLRSVFLSLLEASKLKDNDTGKHIERVNRYSKLMATTLFDRRGFEEIDRDFIDDIGFLASMHDVGKIGTPDDILNKEGPLEDWEWSVMKEHTKNGAYILSTYPNPMAREIALYHHERWNGAGYPYGIDSTMIPLAARIVTIADVYDALRMKRSYKDAMCHGDAVEQIVSWRETHFDPRLVNCFTALERKFETIYEENRDRHGH